MLNEQTARKSPTNENHSSGVPTLGCVATKLSGVFKVTERLFTMVWVERNQLPCGLATWRSQISHKSDGFSHSGLHTQAEDSEGSGRRDI